MIELCAQAAAGSFFAVFPTCGSTQERLHACAIVMPRTDLSVQRGTRCGLSTDLLRSTLVPNACNDILQQTVLSRARSSDQIACSFKAHGINVTKQPPVYPPCQWRAIHGLSVASPYGSRPSSRASPVYRARGRSADAITPRFCHLACCLLDLLDLRPPAPRPPPPAPRTPTPVFSVLPATTQTWRRLRCRSTARRR